MQLMTAIKRIRGKNCHGWPDMDEKLSNSRSKLPQEGRGSATPRPSTPRLASARMKTGTAIQNWAKSTGLKFGTTCRHNKRNPPLPEARASKIKSDREKERASAQITRAAAAHPRLPSKANVTSTEVNGAMFNGRSARTVMSRKSQGRERNRSVAAITQRSSHPPTKPAEPPIKAASMLANSAAAGASKSETRVRSEEHTSEL